MTTDESNYDDNWTEENVDFSSSSPERNVALLVEDRELYVSKEALSLYSPVFRNLFYGHFKEANQSVIPLPEKCYEHILELLKCLFPCPYVKGVSLENVKVLLPLAEEYQILDLKRRCEQFLLSTTSRLSTSMDDKFQLETLALACKFRLNKLKEQLVPNVSQLPCKKIEEYHDQLTLGVIAVLYQNKCCQCFQCTHDLQSTEKGKCSSCERTIEKTATCKTCRKILCFSCLITRKPNNQRVNGSQDCCSFSFSSDLLTRKK